jgi:YjbE family integral membrane protein
MSIFGLLAAGASIVLVDLALSSDNALVIGAVAARLPDRQQRAAILWGGVGAYVFRIVLTGAATEVLRIQLLQVIGGLVVLWIAIRLAMADNDGKPRWQSKGNQMFSAILTITVADVTMSLDNVLAIGALAAGNLVLLSGGLLLSMALLFAASAVVALLIRRLWALLDLAVLVLGWTAANLIVHDPWLMSQAQQLRLPGQGPAVLNGLIYALCIAIALVATLRYHFIPQLQEHAKTRMRPADPVPDDEPSSDRHRATREG